jgi:interleukin-1 receptor-associated kinase 1
VYSGELRDQQKVAVKKLTWPVVWTDYVNEIMILGNLGHRNVVKLLGWCCRDQNPISNILSRCFGAGSDELYLVYELVSNKSVFEHLHGEHKLLPWQQRYNIALGIGAAIIYLHTGCEKPILHRDIKPSNVMLDDNFVPKLGDFGLVRQLRTGRSELTGTGMIGTRAYMDPEVQNSNSATTASDMYSFGVLLLELATGTQPTVSQGPGPGALLNGIRRSYHRGEVLTMADRRLEGKFDKIQMQRVLVVGLLCTQQGNHRPDIRKAVNYLSNLDHPVPEVLSVV